MSQPVYVGYAARTPIFELTSPVGAAIPAPELGAIAVREVVRRSGLPPEAIDEVIMGQVAQAGSGAYPHRQVVLKAGLPVSTLARLVREECGSGSTAIYTAYDAVISDRISSGCIIVAGGMENMLAPWFVDARDILPDYAKGREAGKVAIKETARIISGLQDGLTNSIPNADGLYLNTIQCADAHAKKYGIAREELDSYALESWKRAITATQAGYFKKEIIAVRGVEDDEAPMLTLKKFNTNGEFDSARFEEKVRAMHSIYPDGVITPLNASRISHGAAAMLIFSEAGAERALRKYGVQLVPQARILDIDRISVEPDDFPITPNLLIQKARADITMRDDVSYEINEAFANVPEWVKRHLALQKRQYINPSGGAIAMGHPVGATGARLMVTLLNNMQRMNFRYGMTVICIGGGAGTSITVERV